MFSIKRLIWLCILALPHAAIAAECEPSAAMTPDELARHHYVRQQASSCDIVQEQKPRPMWKLNEGAASAWPYQFAGQCTPAKGRSYQLYGCLAPEGCAIFAGKDKLRVHIRRSDLACKGGVEP